MAPKQVRVYARGRSKSVAPSARMVIGSDDERDPEYEAPSVDPAEDTVLAVLFSTSEILSPPPREHAKRRRGRGEDEARERKKESREMEAARRASLAEEETRQMRERELATGTSSS